MNPKKQALKNSVSLNLPDNNAREISPARLRQVLDDMLDFPEQLHAGTVQELTNGENAVIEWDVDRGYCARLVLNSDSSNVLSIVNAQKGGVYSLIVKQDSEGIAQMTFPENSLYKLKSSAPFQPTQWRYAVDILTVLYDGEYFYWTLNRDYCRLKTFVILNFKGAKIWGYPFGLFSKEGNYVRVIKSKQDFNKWWAEESGYGRYRIVGTIDPAIYRVVDYDGQAPTTITGLNCFQMDTDNIKADSVPVPEGGYIDWGDGVLTHAVTPYANTEPTVHLYNTYEANEPFGLFVRNSSVFQETATIANRSYRFQKDYADDRRKTITVMFNGDEDFRFTMDNSVQYPALYAQSVKNLRGYFPIGTKEIEFSNTQEVSFNTFRYIKNWDQVKHSVLRFALRDGDGTSAPMNLNFGAYDLPNLRCLDLHTYSYHNFGIRWTPIQLKQQFGVNNLTVKFPHLKSIGFKGLQYTPDLDFSIPDLQLGHFGSYHIMEGGTDNALPAGAADRIMQQVDSAKTDTGGILYLFGMDTMEGAFYKASLMAKGMTVVTNL